MATCRGSDSDALGGKWTLPCTRVAPVSNGAGENRLAMSARLNTRCSGMLAVRVCNATLSLGSRPWQARGVTAKRTSDPRQPNPRWRGAQADTPQAG